MCERERDSPVGERRKGLICSINRSLIKSHLNSNASYCTLFLQQLSCAWSLAWFLGLKRHQVCTSRQFLWVYFRLQASLLCFISHSFQKPPTFQKYIKNSIWGPLPLYSFCYGGIVPLIIRPLASWQRHGWMNTNSAHATITFLNRKLTAGTS